MPDSLRLKLRVTGQENAATDPASTVSTSAIQYTSPSFDFTSDNVVAPTDTGTIPSALVKTFRYVFNTNQITQNIALCGTGGIMVIPDDPAIAGFTGSLALLDAASGAYLGLINPGGTGSSKPSYPIMTTRAGGATLGGSVANVTLRCTAPGDFTLLQAPNVPFMVSVVLF